MKNVTFCPECRKEVEYIEIEKGLKGTLKGETIEYFGKVAYCRECKAETYVCNLHDENLKALYDAYRVKHDIISVERIQEIPQKYGIGKRPLSRLLGWGEQTFSRYFDGDMPTKQYSDVLKNIYDDPQYYRGVLEKNKENLGSESAYVKSKKAVEQLINEKKCGTSKINLVIRYLLNRCELSPLALQKVLYYIQGFHYAFYGRFLFPDDCEAWIHGPVYKDVYFEYSRYGSDSITKVEDIDISAYTTAELSIINSVIKHFCCYSAKVLEQFTHWEMPWVKTRGDLPENERTDRIIDKDLLGQYFVSVKDKYNMINPIDIKIYAQDMFRQMD